jgi:hypothetical protein
VNRARLSDKARARFGLGLGLLAGLVALFPGLRSPLVIDDHFHVAWLERTAALHRAPWDLYRWVSPGETEHLIRAGHIPWWADPRLRIAVFRPVSSLSRWLDHAALRDDTSLAHVHSLIWWAALVALVWRGLQNTLSATLRSLAITLVALSPTLLVPVRWLADRNALIAFTFLAAAWCASERRGGDERLPLGVIGFSALAALGGEIAWSLLPVIIVLHALRTDDRPRSARFAVAATIGLMSVLLVSRALGYGIHHSGIYLDPFTQPAEFLRQLPLRMALMASRLPATSLGVLLPAPAALAEILALPVYLLALTLPLALLPGRRPRALLLVAAIASLLPVLPAVPSLRLLFAHHLSVIAFALWPSPTPVPPARHALAVSPLALLLLGVALATPRDAWRPHAAPSAVASLSSLGIGAEDRVLLVSTSNFEVFQHPDVIRRSASSPSEWLVACSARSPILLTRSGSRTLSLRAATPLLHPADLYRSHHLPLHVGDRRTIGRVTIEVRAVSDGRPTWLELDLGEDLDTHPWLLLEARGLRLIRLPLLRVGSSALVSAG